jgi:hypothetical protein
MTTASKSIPFMDYILYYIAVGSPCFPIARSDLFEKARADQAERGSLCAVLSMMWVACEARLWRVKISGMLGAMQKGTSLTTWHCSGFG